MTLTQLTADLPVIHGFFTRQGGVSTGLYAELNCGRGSQDEATNVDENRARVAKAVGVTPENLLSVHQIHSDICVIAEPGMDRPEADAMATNNSDIALGILTADCGPVLFADAEAGVVGAAHAGWKGALGGVLGATIRRMEDLGADRARIRAVLGPTISQNAYEVGPDFGERFMDEDPSYARFFSGGKGDRLMFNLPSFILDTLRREEEIADAEWIGECTYSNPGKFFSYRRTTHQNEPDYGRLISVIRAQPIS
ncbi:peptidoglycan editing factor PgeF [Paracoccaceae bacterium GXU_MW_L88]